MATVRVTHSIDGLARDLGMIPQTMKVRGKAVVRKNVEQGNLVARDIAKRAAGAHGKNYFRRITAEMTGPMTGEWGPKGPPKSDYVGVDGTAGAMRDLVKSAQRQGPRFARDVGRMVDGLFWPGA
jgi:hypothetical protein